MAASTARPDQMLIGFARVTLEPGESCRVSFTVHPSRLAFFDPQMRFVVEPGAFTFSVARPRPTMLQKTIVLTGCTTEWKQREVVPTAVRVHELNSASQRAGSAAT